MPNDDEFAYCAACRTLVPIVRPMIGKGIALAATAIVGRRMAKNPWGALAVAGLTLLGGHLLDQQLAHVCGACGGALPSRLA